MMEPVMLPDGKMFETWEVPLTFTQTYHVARNHPQASDENPGTAEKPWKTIGKAAAVLVPGQRVMIHEGIYREWVNPARGGISPETMISYEAAEGESVVLKGSDVWKPRWQQAKYYAPKDIVTWQAELSGSMFEGANVFCLPNFPDQGHPDWKIFPTFELRRGQLFLHSQPLTQVNNPDELLKEGSRFWVEDNGMTIHLRLAGDVDPNDMEFEITTREQVFAPTTRYLNYIRVKGLKLFHAANGVPIPPPQRGLLSATAGHHWIIEDCEIGYANTLGMDLGGQWWSYGQGEKQSFHIVRGNFIHHCGVSAVSAWHNMVNEHMLVEDNLVTDCGWMPITDHYETAGIKIHRTLDSVFRRNVILRTANCASLWLDGEIMNTRITQNLFAEAANPAFGHIFLEINYGPNLIDNNILINSGGNGFYEHDAERVFLMQNLIANGDDTGVMIRWGDVNRVKPRAGLENEHRVFGNIIAGFPRYIQFPNTTNRADMNLYGWRNDDFRKAFRADATYGQDGTEMNLSQWQQHGDDQNSIVARLNVFFRPEDLTLRIEAVGLDALPAYDDFAKNVPPVTSVEDFLVRTTPQVASADKLLTQDFFGQKRPAGAIRVGPFVHPPLDGTPFSVDPRKRKPQ